MILLLLALLVSEPATAEVVSAPSFPLRIDTIEINGPHWTRRTVVLTEVGFREGDTITEHRWELARTRLWNTELFGRVAAHIETRGERTVAVYDLEERISVNPLFKLAFGGNALWIRAGVSDTNFLGSYIEIGAVYERFNTTNGAAAWVHEPRLFGKRLDTIFLIERLSRPRPEFVDLRTHGNVAMDVLLDEDRMRVELGADVLYDSPYAPLTGPTDVPSAGWYAAATPGLKVGRIDTVRLRQRGYSLEVKSALGKVFVDPTPAFAQVTMEHVGFLMLGERLNLAWRVRGGASSPVSRPYRFYIGGLDLVRGLNDNAVRTDLFALFNAEARLIIFDSTWIALMGVGFCDGVIARTEAGGPITAAASVGFGVRVLIPKFVRTGLRADVALPLSGAPLFSPSIGVYQFF